MSTSSAEEVTAGLEGMEAPLRVAVMGCVVNGPGEAREADLGVASGNGKARSSCAARSSRPCPSPRSTLINEAMRLAESGEIGTDAEGAPTVTTY